MRYSPQTLGHLVNFLSMDFHNRIAITHIERNRTRNTTYRQLLDFAEAVGVLLIQHDLAPGDRIIIRARNSPEWVAVFLGCAMTGIVLIPADHFVSAETMKDLIERYSPKLVLCDDDAEEGLNKCAVPCLALSRMVEMAAASEPGELMRHDRFISGDDIVEIVHTRGTRGEQRAVPISNRNLIANIQSLRMRILFSPGWRFLSVLPLSRIMEQVAGCLCVLRFGGRIVYTERHSFPDMVAALKTDRITTMLVTPQVLSSLKQKFVMGCVSKRHRAMLGRVMGLLKRLPFAARRLLALPLRARLGFHLDAFICGGSALDEDIEDFWESMGIRVVQGYGLTEASTIVACNSYDIRKRGSVGLPLMGQFIRVAPDGELHIAGENVISEYFGQPDITARSFEDGWLKTGDIATIDETGYLYILGHK